MRKGLILALVGVLLLLSLGTALAKDEVKYVNSAALKAMLGDPQLLVVDVRTPKDWNSSDKKVKGALRQDPTKVADWGKTLPPGKKIVLYCA